MDRPNLIVLKEETGPHNDAGEGCSTNTRTNVEEIKEEIIPCGESGTFEENFPVTLKIEVEEDMIPQTTPKGQEGKKSSNDHQEKSSYTEVHHNNNLRKRNGAGRFDAEDQLVSYKITVLNENSIVNWYCPVCLTKFPVPFDPLEMEPNCPACGKICPHTNEEENGIAEISMDEPQDDSDSDSTTTETDEEDEGNKKRESNGKNLRRSCRKTVLRNVSKGKVKKSRGRPRKLIVSNDVKKSRGRPRKLIVCNEVKKSRGRPRKLIVSNDVPKKNLKVAAVGKSLTVIKQSIDPPSSVDSHSSDPSRSSTQSTFKNIVPAPSNLIPPSPTNVSAPSPTIAQSPSIVPRHSSHPSISILPHLKVTAPLFLTSQTISTGPSGPINLPSSNDPSHSTAPPRLTVQSPSIVPSSSIDTPSFVQPSQTVHSPSSVPSSSGVPYQTTLSKAPSGSSRSKVPSHSTVSSTFLAPSASSSLSPFLAVQMPLTDPSFLIDPVQSPHSVRSSSSIPSLPTVSFPTTVSSASTVPPRSTVPTPLNIPPATTSPSPFIVPSTPSTPSPSKTLVPTDTLTREGSKSSSVCPTCLPCCSSSAIVTNAMILAEMQKLRKEIDKRMTPRLIQQQQPPPLLYFPLNGKGLVALEETFKTPSHPLCSAFIRALESKKQTDNQLSRLKEIVTEEALLRYNISGRLGKISVRSSPVFHCIREKWFADSESFYVALSGHFDRMTNAKRRRRKRAIQRDGKKRAAAAEKVQPTGESLEIEDE